VETLKKGGTTVYTTTNFKSKAELKRAVAEGKTVRVFQPSGDLTGVTPPSDGRVFLEGPHSPQPHRWYAEAQLENGKVVKVK
jgi:hypothetical protein